jgi:hypothetical protein
VPDGGSDFAPVECSPAREEDELDPRPQETANPEGRWFRRIALLERFPRLGRDRPEDEDWPRDWPVVRPEDQPEYSEIAQDLALWVEQLHERYRRLDHRALSLQNRFWRQHVALIGGGLVATSLGAVQAAKGGGMEELAALQAVLTGMLAGLTVLVRSGRAQQGYLTARLKAERIKSEFFLFLARAGDYAAVASPAAKLQEQVEDIEAAEGAT